ncbi:MAG: hypothetical protein MO852_03960 [Candidatus Devosia euplotis]|nr:hypothetical protein [Candidatus Devosia euplotis]
MTAFNTPEFRKVVDVVRAFSREAAPETQNCPWNETAHTMVAGKALMHIMSDWMKGEWKAAGKVPGVDFGCNLIAGALAVPVTSDAFGLLGGQSDAKMEAEYTFAAAALSAEVSGAFAQAKGATPARLDAPSELLDQCSQVVIDQLKVDNGSVMNPFNVTDFDWHQAIWSAMFNF